MIVAKIVFGDSPYNTMHLIALSYFPKITQRRYSQLASFFSSIKDAWQGEIGEFVKAGWSEGVAVDFINWREKFDLEKMQTNLAKENIHTLTIEDNNYPKLLKEITDPPFCIFYRGNLSSLQQPSLSVVGNRKFTPYGKYACQKIVSELSQQKMTIVSGLALGIDAIAHQTCLNNQGKTIAVLGSGINKANVSPFTNFQLSEKIIAQGGAILSEYSPGTQPTKYTFPTRNRIIAGLTLGTLIIEAAKISGALITARCALDYNREVFTIPHNLTSANGVGCNKLLKNGAVLTTKAEDIINELNLVSLETTTNYQTKKPTDEIEQQILSTLGNQTMHIDLIIKNSRLDSNIINGKLILMEMNGLVKNIGNMTYVAIIT